MEDLLGGLLVRIEEFKKHLVPRAKFTKKDAVDFIRALEEEIGSLRKSIKDTPLTTSTSQLEEPELVLELPSDEGR